MKLLIVCDKLATEETRLSAEKYARKFGIQRITFPPSHPQQGGLPGDVIKWNDAIGGEQQYAEIYILGHGNIKGIGGLSLSNLAGFINDLKPDNGSCEVILLACNTANEGQQVLDGGFQAGNLVSNVAKLVDRSVFVNGYTVGLPMDPEAPLPNNFAQGQTLRAQGSLG